jgi:hypothetical protein
LLLAPWIPTCESASGSMPGKQHVGVGRTRLRGRRFTLPAEPGFIERAAMAGFALTSTRV